MMTKTMTAARMNKLVAETSTGLPSLSVWLDRIAAIGNEHLTEAIDGIWCGRDGCVRLSLPDPLKPATMSAFLCMGWHEGKVEFCYLTSYRVTGGGIR